MSSCIIYSDGAYSSSRDQGGWAFVAVDIEGTKIHSDYGDVKTTTNNRMEIQGCLEGIKWAKECKYPELTIISDSMYVIGTMTKNWKRKVNVDLWVEIDDAITGLNIEWKHVKGHSGDKWNEHCDMLACHASQIC